LRRARSYENKSKETGTRSPQNRHDSSRTDRTIEH
jgi:hypothetical protein